MSVTSKEVDYIAKLARLSFTDEERLDMTKDINAILHYMETLNRLSTEHVEPLMFMTSEDHVLRDDIVGENISLAGLRKNASEFQDRFFKVPKVINQVN